MSELLNTKRDGEVADSSSDAVSYTPPPPNLPRLETTRAKESSAGSLFGYTIFALGLALFIRFFIAAPYVVSGASMEPNFHNWDYLITDRISYRVIEPARGDVIVFHLPHEYSRTLIKRLIGLPGDTVEVEGNSVRIKNATYPDGFTLSEEYLAPENYGGPTNVTITLGENQYFVLGDNRHVSSDSRSWGILPGENIVGRVLVRLFPLDTLSVLPAEARYGE